MPVVSIIVPIYNAEKYLEKCLNSLVKQTLSDIEIIALNDGSTDKSAEILAELQKKYADKLCVYHQENVGISETRNRGIHYAKGTYISFVDSDDSVDLTFCEKMVDKMESSSLDMVVCEYYEVSGEKRIRKAVPACDENTVIEKPEILFEINTSPWNKLYRREFLLEHDILFPVGLKYEDAVFMQKILAKRAKVGSVHEPLVYYVIHSGSESTVVKKNVFDIFEILDEVAAAYSEFADAEYCRVKQYLEYFTINRITVYNIQQIYQEDPQSVATFIAKGFQYLDTKFPQWRKNELFHENNNIVKRMIKKHEWITKNVVMVIRKIRR